VEREFSCPGTVSLPIIFITVSLPGREHILTSSTNTSSMAGRLYPSSSTLEIPSRRRLQPTGSKRRRMQQQSENLSSFQPHHSMAVSSSLHSVSLNIASQRPRPSPLVIPQPTVQHSKLSFMQISPEVSPKTVLPSWNDVLNTTMGPATIMTQSEEETSPTVHPQVLRPCHVCYRRPSTRSMLDAYADCELCGQRACYICLRECDAPECIHKEKPGQTRICSQCAVEGLTERGEEIVWCVECVKALGSVDAM
jgi:hypothetical protein